MKNKYLITFYLLLVLSLPHLLFAQTVVADAGPDQNFNCITDTITIGGVNTSMGPEFEYNWVFNTDTISTEPFYDATNAGPYILNVKNIFTNEMAADTVILGGTFEFIGLGVTTDGELSCTSPTMSIDVFTELFFFEETSTLWTTVDGNINSDPTQNEITISQPGIYTVVVTNLSSGCTGTETILVDGDIDVPIANISSSAVLNCTTQVVLLDGTGSSTGPDFVYVWTSPLGNIISGELVAEVNNCGTYILEVSNTATGCFTIATVDVLCDFNSPSVIINTPEILPLGGLVQLDASLSTGNNGGVLMYQWTSADGNIVSSNDANVVTVDSPGTYCLTITNLNNGCSSTGCVLVQQAMAPDVVADAGPDQTLTCGTVEVMIGSTNSSMGSEFTYEWTDLNGVVVGTTPFISITQPGTYTLIVTNISTGDMASDQVEITQNIELPNVFIPGVEILSCSDPEVLIIAVIDETDSVEIVWTDVSGMVLSNTEQVTIDTAGVYLLTVTNILNGCFTTQSVTVSEDTDVPTAIIDIQGPGECGELLTLDPSSIILLDTLCTYEWLPQEGLTVDSVNPLIAIFDMSGTYTLVKTDATTNCKENFIFPVMVLLNPIADAGPDLVISCSDPIGAPLGGANTSIGSDFTYSWTTSDGEIIGPSDEPTAIPAADGVYTLVVTDLSSDCTAIDQVEVTLVPLLEVLIIIEGTIPCFGFDGVEVDVEVMGGTPPYEIIWDYPISDPPLEAGTYGLTVTDAEDCFVTEMFTITQPDELLVDIVVNADGNIEAQVTGGTSPYMYEWSDGTDGPIIVDPVEGTEYILNIEDANGCLVASSIVYESTAVLQANAKQLHLYPNPTQQNVTITLENISSSIDHLEIIDMQGRGMTYRSTFTDSHTMQLSLSDLPAGTYFVHAIIDAELYFQKLLVIK